MARRYIAVMAIAGILAAQTPPSPKIRVDVDLIQFDVTVTDRNGRRVPSLTAADFEVWEGGRRRPISGLLWIGKRSRSEVPAAGAGSSFSRSRQLEASQVRRTIAVVLDDLSLRPEGLTGATQALEKFIRSDIEPGDLVAIFRTSSGMSFLQQFTSDRAQLLAALGRASIRALNQAASRFVAPRDLNQGYRGPALGPMALEQIARDQELRRRQQDERSAAALTSLQYVTRGLGELPGRKSLVLFTESIQLFDSPPPPFINPTPSGVNVIPMDTGGSRVRTVAALHQLTDLANRSGVVIYAVDPRGPLSVGSMIPQRPLLDLRSTMANMDNRVIRGGDSVEGIGELTQATGGLSFQNTNDLPAALREALADQEDYYLLSFPPAEPGVSRARASELRRITIRVKRPGLQLRYRRGYLPGGSSTLTGASNSSPLLSALVSPFRARGIPLRLTPVVRQMDLPSSAKGAAARVYLAAVRTLVHMDVSGLTYRSEAAEAGDSNRSPWECAKVQLAVYLFDPDQRPIQVSNRTHEIRLRGATRDFVLRHGLIEEFDLPIERPGGYQLRAAVWQPESDLTGSAAHFVPIPDFAANRLTSSDLVVSGEAGESAEKAARSSPALRVFSPGDKLNYAMRIYGASQGAAPELESQVALYQNGRLAYRGPARPVRLEPGDASQPVNLEGFISIGPQSPPGDYVLEVAVRNRRAAKNAAFTVRAVDFEVR